MAFHSLFRSKFYWGIFLIVGSTLVGKTAQFAILFYFDDIDSVWIPITIYVLSWIPLLLGVWWVGKEYADAVQRYFSLKFYHEAVKKGAKRAVDKTKTLGKHVGTKTKETLRKIKKRKSTHLKNTIRKLP